MRIAFKTILLIAGIGVIIWSIKPFGLLAFGNKADGVITEVVNSDLTTEMTGGRRSIKKPSGFFKVKTKVKYTFDIL